MTFALLGRTGAHRLTADRRSPARLELVVKPSLRIRSPRFNSIQFIKKQGQALLFYELVELKGIEPSTYRLRTCRSPN